MANKKVLIVGFAFSPGVGGEWGTTNGWAQSLVDSGCDVTVLYHPDVTSPGMAPPAPVTFRTIPLRLGNPLDRLKHHDWRVWYQAWLYFAERSMRHEHFDAVICVSLSSLLVYNPFFRANADVSVIAGTGPLRWPAAVPKPPGEIIMKATHALAEQVAVPSLKRWDRILPSNPETHAWLIAKGLNPCPVELDIGLWELPPPIVRRSGANRVVTYSNTFFIARKGLAHAIELFRQLPSLSLDIYGRDSRGKVAGIVRDAPPNVKWHGELSRTALMQRLPEYDAIFLPSLRENTGSPALEALALGLPVASFRGSGPNAVLGEDAGLSLSPNLSVARQELATLPQVVEQWTNQRAAQNRARASENLWPQKAARLLSHLSRDPVSARHPALQSASLAT